MDLPAILQPQGADPLLGGRSPAASSSIKDERIGKSSLRSDLGMVTIDRTQQSWRLFPAVPLMRENRAEIVEKLANPSKIGIAN